MIPLLLELEIIIILAIAITWFTSKRYILKTRLHQDDLDFLDEITQFFYIYFYMYLVIFGTITFLLLPAYPGYSTLFHIFLLGVTGYFFYIQEYVIHEWKYYLKLIKK